MSVTPQTNTTFDEIEQVMHDADNFVICGHVGPDGDCLGCQLTLHHALKAMGKNSTCVLVKDEPVSLSLSFMPGMRDMVPASDFDGPCDVFVGVDVPTRERIGDAAALLDRSSISITIDHHASDTTMCDYVYVDPDSASASMLVWEVVKRLLDVPPYESALCAYTGLVTDTGGFQFNNSDARAFSAASELIAQGVDPSKVATQVFQNRTRPSLELEALVIKRMRVFNDGQAALSWISLADMQETGAVKSDAEPLIDALRSLAGIRVACILREQTDCVRGSLRAKDETDVSALARQLGGGGHRAAAGLTLHVSLNEAIELLEEKIQGIL